MRPEYKVTKNCKHKNRQCRKCGHALKINRKYVLDPEIIAIDGLPAIYHAVCWKQKANAKT